MGKIGREKRRKEWRDTSQGEFFFFLGVIIWLEIEDDEISSSFPSQATRVWLGKSEAVPCRIPVECGHETELNANDFQVRKVTYPESLSQGIGLLIHSGLIVYQEALSPRVSIGISRKVGSKCF